MTLPPPEVDRTREVLQETRKVFVRFLESPQSFLISNQSLQVLVEGFTARLDEAVVDRQELNLLRRWQERAAEARAQALRRTWPSTLVSRERFLPIITQLGASILLDICPPKPEYRG